MISAFKPFSGSNSSTEECVKPKTIKLAILGTRGIPARYGGFETFAEELSHRLSTDNRFEVTVVCPSEGSSQLSPLGKVRRLPVPNLRLGPFTTIMFDALSLWRCRKNFDLVYMLGYAASPFFFIPRMWGTRVWVNMDGLEWRRSKWNILGRTYLKLTEWIASWSSNLMVADAIGIKDYLLKRYGLNKNCIYVAYGAPPLSPGNVSLPAADLVSNGYLLAVARLEPENQVEEIIQGFLDSSCSMPLCVVGGLLPETSYIKRLKQFECGRVRFLGQIYDKHLLMALRLHAYACFHGHTVGGTNPSLLEAIGAGRPIIAHDNVFNREVAGDLACYFSDKNDIPDCLQNKVSIMASDQDLIHKSHEWLKSNYSWEKIAESYKIEIFKNIV